MCFKGAIRNFKFEDQMTCATKFYRMFLIWYYRMSAISFTIFVERKTGLNLLKKVSQIENEYQERNQAKRF